MTLTGAGGRNSTPRPPAPVRPILFVEGARTIFFCIEESRTELSSPDRRDRRRLPRLPHGCDGGGGGGIGFGWPKYFSFSEEWKRGERERERERERASGREGVRDVFARTLFRASFSVPLTTPRENRHGWRSHAIRILEMEAS